MWVDEDLVPQVEVRSGGEVVVDAALAGRLGGLDRDQLQIIAAAIDDLHVDALLAFTPEVLRGLREALGAEDHRGRPLNGEFVLRDPGGSVGARRLAVELRGQLERAPDRWRIDAIALCAELLQDLQDDRRGRPWPRLLLLLAALLAGALLLTTRIVRRGRSPAAVR